MWDCEISNALTISSLPALQVGVRSKILSIQHTLLGCMKGPGTTFALLPYPGAHGSTAEQPAGASPCRPNPPRFLNPSIWLGRYAYYLLPILVQELSIKWCGIGEEFSISSLPALQACTMALEAHAVLFTVCCIQTRDSMQYQSSFRCRSCLWMTAA